MTPSDFARVVPGPLRRLPERRVLLVGAAAGLAAAISGVPAVGPLRPWHLLSALALIAALAGAPSRLAGLRLRFVDVAFVTLMLGGIVVEFVNGQQLGYRANYSIWLAMLAYACTYLGARIVVGSKAQLQSFLLAFVLPSIPSSLLAIGQCLAPKPFHFVTAIAPSTALDRHYADGILIRATGLIGNWTGFGYYLCVVLAACAVLVLAGSLSRRATLYLWGTAVLAAAGVLATVTFATIAIAAIVALPMLLRVRHRIVVLASLAVLAAVGYALFGRLISDRAVQQGAPGATGFGLPGWLPNTVRYRAHIWENETVPAILKRPLTGWGSGVYNSGNPARSYPGGLEWQSAESQWMAVSIMSGVIVAAILAVLCVAVAISLGRLSFTRVGWYALPAFVLSVASLIAAVIFAIYTDRGFPAAFWPFVGAILAAGSPQKWSVRRPLARAEPAAPMADRVEPAASAARS